MRDAGFYFEDFGIELARVDAAVRAGKFSSLAFSFDLVLEVQVGKLLRIDHFNAIDLVI